MTPPILPTIRSFHTLMLEHVFKYEDEFICSSLFKVLNVMGLHLIMSSLYDKVFNISKRHDIRRWRISGSSHSENNLLYCNKSIYLSKKKKGIYIVTSIIPSSDISQINNNHNLKTINNN